MRLAEHSHLGEQHCWHLPLYGTDMRIVVAVLVRPGLWLTAVRQLLSYAGSRQLGLSAAEISRVMNVSGQAILKSAAKAEQTWEGLDWLMEYVE